jgi:SpoVK/Ycf46/Vps4 family AAA+-type ATPase
LFDLVKMSIEFDQIALASWVALCDEERRMREAGATQEQLLAIQRRIIVSMTQLLPTLSEEEKAALTLVLLSSENTTVNEVSDPADIED